MDAKNALSVKDYFNYFFSGFVWIIDCIVLFFLSDAKEFFRGLKLDNFLGFLVSTALLLVIPFIVGFILNPLANWATKALRKITGEPVDRILVLPHQSYREEDWRSKIFYKNQRLAEPYRSKINEKIQTLFGKPSRHNPFYYVRAYVEEKGSDSTKILASRALDLANLAESLLIPVSIFGLLATVKTNLWLSIGVTLMLMFIISYRYIQLRGYWVKHIYRAFLVIKE